MGNYVVALAGNPNTGKTCVFNNLTGSKQQVGNWPGVTVEKKEGDIRYGNRTIRIVDLPGTYSLGAFSEDELVARNYIMSGEADAVINVVDATNLYRNLYLTIQLLEAGADVVVALNMMDEAKKYNIDIDIDSLSKELGVPVISTIASRCIGMDAIIDATIKLDKKNKNRVFTIDYGTEVEKGIEELIVCINKKEELIARYPSRWLAIKLLEADEGIIHDLSRYDYAADILSKAKDLRICLAEELDTKMDSYIIKKRYELIEHIIDKSLFVKEGEEPTTTEKIDSIVTHRIWGLPIFIGIMVLVFAFTFALGEPLEDLVGDGLDAFGEWVESTLAGIGASPIFISFLVDGVIHGLSAVLEIVPLLFLLFLMIGVLEDSGYMARIAYIMDRPMRAIGLHGKAFIPFLLGFGCNVPAIMSTRTLDSHRDRMLTIIANPFISCGARLPVYVLFAKVFFPSHRVLIVISLYLIGILMAVLTTKLFGEKVFKEEDTSFIIELPPYRFPTMRGIFLHMWKSVSAFLKRASTVILSAVIVIWFLSSIPFGVEYASDESVIGKISSFIAPIFKPAGFGTWQATIALISGILAKEVVAGTLGVVYGAGGAELEAVIAQQFTPLSAYSFMVMTLLYAPCIATIGAIRNETKSRKWTFITVAYGFIVAWVLSVLIYQIGTLLGF